MSECYKQILIKSEGCGIYPYCIVDDEGNPTINIDLNSLKWEIDNNSEHFTIPQCDKLFPSFNAILALIVIGILIYYLMQKGGNK